ncbi:hypothetical protein IWW42_003324 [Coemansia sp. RSA 1085]|nr:hypothetical protein LPJ68_004382 [Coemansia sp. RSA 1086]KAJ2649128.1 hypothetical protein IWW40_003390 [Coemansia sp. RSA 1250]KAJ2671539.1 hypothetical protein IWW42_003324 [Coemansia sp. RSA 1085]
MANSQHQKKAIVFIAEGSEEMEAVITIDVLRRAGVQVVVLAVEHAAGPLTCSRGVKISPDAYLGDDVVKIASFDAVVVPGGAGGASIISQSSQVRSILSDFYAQHKIVAAICAGTLAIKAAGIQSKASQPLRVTSHPSVRDQLEHDFLYKEDRVVVDSNLVTSRGPGTSFEFALKLVSLLVGDEKAKEIAAPMILNFSL